jgi:GlpG protein
VWVRSDDDLARAAELLQLYLQNPSDARFQNAGREAATLRRKEGEDEAAYRRRQRKAAGMFQNLSGHRFGIVSYAILFACVAVFVITKYGTNLEPVDSLWLSEHRSFAPLWKRVLDLREVWSGEVWRLLTPIFIHLNIVHIFFNMMWLASLGSLIEARQSRALLMRLVVLLGIGSNLVQFMVTGRPNFGGMSGVVYGLIGYMWMRGKFDPSSGLRLDSYTLIASMIWFFACFTGWVGPIANGAHAGGLVLGMAWGWLAARRVS